MRPGKSIRRALSYNERKLTSNRADLLLAANFPFEDRLMGFSAKMKVFQSLIDRNPKIGTNALHISLNFPPDEILTEDKLRAIAGEYMEQIGFAEQPFLVYRHRDANHPHIHIVTTNLRRYGRPLNMHNLAKDKSDPARKRLERQFALIPAESRPRQQWKPDDIAPWPARYGKEETKHAITNIVGKVISSYKFASLEEFNAVLAQFRISAYRGSPGSRMYNAGGLVYQILDKDGNRVGIPVKASSIAPSPTLRNLEKRFARGELGKMAARDRTKRTIGHCLSQPGGEEVIRKRLEKADIGVVIERDMAGSVKNAFIIDHRRRAVFTADELGINPIALVRTSGAADNAEAQIPGAIPKNEKGGTPVIQQIAIPASTLALINTLFAGEQDDIGPVDTHEYKRKKRRKGPSL